MLEEERSYTYICGYSFLHVVEQLMKNIIAYMPYFRCIILLLIVYNHIMVIN